MFLRSYKREDKRLMQQLFFETVHTVNARDYTREQLEVWAPLEPNRDTWAKIDQQSCFVVEQQKLLVGFISMTESGFVDFLYVHKDYQGKGIASALYKQIERLARKKGITEITAESSITAKGFFDKLGFETEAEVQKSIGGQELAHFNMRKKLAAGSRA